MPDAGYLCVLFHSSLTCPFFLQNLHNRAAMTSSRKDKRWLKSVADPDLVSFFQDPQFDAGDYAKSFFEQREASHAAHRYVAEQWSW